jgi:cobaltochelatase CobN
MFIYFPHGRIITMGGNEAVDWLKKENILVLTPQLVYQTYEKWIADQQGMSGGLFGQNIVVPEIDGAIHPYAVAAQCINKEGYHTFKPIPRRIEKFCETADRWLSLKTKKNVDKKVCIYYYKGAGKNALVAGGLEVGESLFSLLIELKKKGYNTGELPKYLDAFMNRIHTEGPVLGDYAKGTFNEFLKDGNPAMIPVQEYETWVKSELDEGAYKNVIRQYGAAPGKYLTTSINDTSYLAIPRVQFGNVVLLPVLAAAMETNEFKLLHGVKQAPPHAYIASYLWSRMAFKTDVIAHFGAHGRCRIYTMETGFTFIKGLGRSFNSNSSSFICVFN